MLSTLLAHGTVIGMHFFTTQGGITEGFKTPHIPQVTIISDKLPYASPKT
jgi:hypothetical protein